MGATFAADLGNKYAAPTTAPTPRARLRGVRTGMFVLYVRFEYEYPGVERKSRMSFFRVGVVAKWLEEDGDKEKEWEKLFNNRALALAFRGNASFHHLTRRHRLSYTQFAIVNVIDRPCVELSSLDRD
jgi:hypothetical protein